ncbi:hypothetical protein Nepgr_004568 [Nepenthes gracilis]|uniref:Uncharacterized protein n=1 Tax=Nepenthes gracilis TaxID=150966 RepID=A0AAD3XFA0_NEPGR|nr:hypothetical protein Nepgr_004568 [Nepenthes gracilis]
MEAAVQTWLGEVTKLKEKVGAAEKPFFLLSKGKVSSSNLKKEAQADRRDGRGGDKGVNIRRKGSISASSEETTLSDATVCLLLDLFVPC